MSASQRSVQVQKADAGTCYTYAVRANTFFNERHLAPRNMAILNPSWELSEPVMQGKVAETGSFDRARTEHPRCQLCSSHVCWTRPKYRAHDVVQ